MAISSEWEMYITQTPHHLPAKAHLVLPEGAKLMLRTRQPADRFAPIGMKGKHQKVKDWMIARKIPQPVRDKIPLLVVNDEVGVIFWGDTYPVSHHFGVYREDSIVWSLFVYAKTTK